MVEASVWLIAGPTASGKSALALDLAQRIGGEIVNADSMQVYRDLRVLTARPTQEDEAAAPHHLFGVADGAEAWSVGRWLRAAEPVLAEIAGRSRPAIVVGGAGLYLRALTDGLAEVPAVPATIRAAVAADYERDGEAAFRARLRAVDPEAEARIASGDRQRLTRAQEVATGTGRPLSAWRADTTPAVSPGSWRGAVLEPVRPALYARIDARFDAMLADGALAEVDALMARGLPQKAPIMKALGVRELAAHLTGTLPLDSAAEAARRETRRFAKRQSTWFRNQAPDWPRLADSEAAATWLTSVKQSS